LLGSSEQLAPDQPLHVRYAGIAEAGAFRINDGLNQSDEHRFIEIAPHPRFPAQDQFALMVEGDSMVNAFIDPGSWVIALKVDTWQRLRGELANDLLVVAVRRRIGFPEQEVTIKRLHKFPDRWELRPESSNPKHKPIVYPFPPKEDDAVEVEIVAVVLSTVRDLTSSFNQSRST
jgi:SOS-response transcriptional repressor LexA